MTFRIFGGMFTARLVPTCSTVLMLVMLVGLGAWQVERLHWKGNLLAAIKARTAEAPIDVSTIKLEDDIARFDYRAATTTGTFLHDHELYRVAVSLNGAGGYHVLTPLQLADGRFMLMDRGWIPYDKKESTTRQAGQTKGTVTIRGVLRLPHHVWMQPANQPEKNIWYSLDLAAMATAARVPSFVPLVLEADATPNEGGLPIGGQTRLEIPNNHLVYAITWYGLAFALLVIYGISGWRRG